MDYRRTHSGLTPPSNSILLLGPDAPLQTALEEELHAFLGSVTRADSLEDAIEQADQLTHPPSVVLIPEANIRPASFEEQLAELKIRSSASQLVPVAIGCRPDEARRHALRDAGVRLALFGRFGRHALRFQINRALSMYANRLPRGDLRAPMEWRTRTYSGGRRKTVRCYSLSIGGAYLVTPRPWVVGSDIDLEIPIAGANRRIGGRILYTKGADARERPTLPGGMAVAFRPLSQPLCDAIRRDLTHIQVGLEV